MLCVASHWKATIHIYSLKKFQKIQIFFAVIAVCPESLNSIYGAHRPLGVNELLPCPLKESLFKVLSIPRP
jgi:hypothetical protein